MNFRKIKHSPHFRLINALVLVNSVYLLHTHTHTHTHTHNLARNLNIKFSFPKNISFIFFDILSYYKVLKQKIMHLIAKQTSLAMACNIFIY